MKELLRKAGPVGLIIIAAAAIASVRSSWTAYHTAAAVIGGALILTALILNMKEIRSGMRRRSARFGINSATSVLLLLGVLAMVNYLGAQHEKRIDLTSEQIYSLSTQSVEVARQIPEDIHIRAFYPGGENPQD